MKRQLFGMLLLAVLCLCLAACGGSEQTASPAPLAGGSGSIPAAPDQEPSAEEPDIPEAPDDPASLAEPAPWPEGIPEPSALPVSQTVEGWTLTLTRAEGDKYCAYFHLDVTAPEGVALDADSYFLNCIPMLESAGCGGMGIDMVDDGDKTDNKISFVVDFFSDEDIRGARGVLEAADLRAIHLSRDHQNDTVTPVAGVQWQLPFQIESLENTVVYQLGQRVETSQGPVTVDRVEIGPYSVELEVSGPNITEVRLEQASDLPPRSGTVTFRLEDQSGAPLSLSGTSTTPKGKDAMTLVSSFSRQIVPIDPAAVAALVLEGTRVPLG